MIQIEVTRSRQNFPQLMDLLIILGFDTGDWGNLEDTYSSYTGSDPINDLSNKFFGTDMTTFYVVCDWTDKSISVNNMPMSEANLYTTDVDNVFIAIRVERSRLEFADLIKNFVEDASNIKEEAVSYFKHPRLQKNFYYIDSEGKYEIGRFYPFEVMAINNNHPLHEWLPLTADDYARYTKIVYLESVRYPDHTASR